MFKEEGGRRPHLGAGMRACAAMMKRSMMKEQTRLELNISSLIWENWVETQRNSEQTHSGPPGVLPQLTLVSMASLNTSVRGAMCSLRIRSLLRTSMACLMRLLISFEVECQMFGSEPSVKEARICRSKREEGVEGHFSWGQDLVLVAPTLFMSIAFPNCIS